MPIRSIRYRFIQHFNVPALEAYRWCTSYDPKDLSLMGEKGKREIQWISKDAVILSDSFRKKNRGTFTKKKIVRLDPSTLSWTNTHIAGPVKYSQFLYKIVPEGKSASRLEFRGLQLQNFDARNKQKTSTIASKIRKEDSGSWKLLAKELNKDFGQKG